MQALVAELMNRGKPLQDDNEKRIEILEKIEERLHRIERDLRTSSEDQLFFALVFALAVLFITLPMDSVRFFFQEFARLTPTAANSVAQSILYVGLLCLLLSSVVRYYAAVVGKVRRSKSARVLSIEFLIMAWDGALFAFIVSVVLNINLLGIYKIPFAALTSLATFTLMVWIENKVLGFYASSFLIFKKDVTAIASNLFARLALSLYAAFLIAAFLASVIVVSSEQFVAIFIGAWFSVFAVLYLVYFHGLRRR